MQARNTMSASHLFTSLVLGENWFRESQTSGMDCGSEMPGTADRCGDLRSFADMDLVSVERAGDRP